MSPCNTLVHVFTLALPVVTLTLLSRAYCHLCDEMRDALAPLAAAHGARVLERDVDADPALEARYGDRVPVLFAGEPGSGVEVCHYVLDRPRALAALSGKPLAPGPEIR
jgi:hypothetical protein